MNVPMTVVDALISQARGAALPLAVHTPDGAVHLSADAPPEFRLHILNEAGMRALLSLNELPISEAYLRGDIDLEGDLVRALSMMRGALTDTSPLLKVWRRLHPLLVGRESLNPQWIAKHYDSKNVQLLAQDQDYFTYTPGIYERDDESMEAGAARKLQFAFDNLRLKEGDSLLEVGCGWGGFTRFCARRKVRVTGITLSRDQLEFTRERLRDEALEATALYQDFFTYEPNEKVDGISMMGVIEDLSDYPRVVERIARWLKPGGRAYLDFAAAVEPFGTSSFVTKYIWPGTFRMVYMPELVAAVTHSPLEMIGITTDRRNYHLWAKKGHARWVERKEEVVAASSVETWRLFRLLFAGTAGVMDSPLHHVTAFRVVLELPADAAPEAHRSRPRPDLDALFSQVKLRLAARRGRAGS